MTNKNFDLIGAGGAPLEIELSDYDFDRLAKLPPGTLVGIDTDDGLIIVELSQIH